MNPLTLNPLPLLAGAVVALAVGVGIGWTANGWRLETNVAAAKLQTAEQLADAANKALDQITTRMDNMNTATTAAQLDVHTLAVKMDLIRKEQKDAQAQKPLPPDCVPTAGRLDRLRDAVGAANAAITGSVPR